VGCCWPRYSAAKVAEVFTVLAASHGQRLDVGLGRAAEAARITCLSCSNCRRSSAHPVIPVLPVPTRCGYRCGCSEQGPGHPGWRRSSGRALPTVIFSITGMPAKRYTTIGCIFSRRPRADRTASSRFGLWWQRLRAEPANWPRALCSGAAGKIWASMRRFRPSSRRVNTSGRRLRRVGAISTLPTSSSVHRNAFTCSYWRWSVESYLLLAAPFEDSRTSNRPQSEGVSV